MALRKRGARASGAPKQRYVAAADLLVVGLGNPGARYAHTRHNVGAMVVETLAKRHHISLTLGAEAAFAGDGPVDGRRLALAFPQTFMNRSGESVRPLVRCYQIEDLSRLVIVHDELDLPPGTVRVKFGGGLAGHNGLKSIRDHLHTTDFTRIRIGIGRPSGSEDVADYVLRPPSSDELIDIDIGIEHAADACDALLTDSLDAVMNRYNQRSN